MPDRGALLYLTALLHDVGKRVSRKEAEDMFVAHWKKHYCPSSCSGENCPVSKLGHPLRGALFLLLTGFPQEYGHVVANVLAHHGQKSLCSLFVEQFAKLTGTVPAAQRDQIRLDSTYGGDLREIFSRADHLASSVSRIDLENVPGDTRALLFSGKARLYYPFWVLLDTFQLCEMGLRQSPADDIKRLLADQSAMAKLLEGPDLFSGEWAAFRNSLFTWLAPVAEAQPDPKEEETTFSVDVSLSTHSALAAGIAMCYFRNGQKPAKPKAGAPPIPSQLSVVCLTFNGAERVVEVPSDGALRQLRGRSASVSLMVDSFIRRLLAELDLPLECILLRWYSGVFVLVPNRYSQKQKNTREVLGRLVQSLEKEFSRIPLFAPPRVTLVPIYLGSRTPQTTDKERPSGEQLYLRRAMRQAWHLAAYGHQENDECGLIWAGKPPDQIGLTGASRCRVCGTPFPQQEGLCPRCQEVERIGIAINQRQFKDCGLHLLPKKASPPANAVCSLQHLGVYVAPGGWRWQPPVGPGSPQQVLERQALDQGAKAKIGIALVRWEAIERLFSKMNEQHLLPARLAECFRLAEQFFRSLHREEEDLWALRWSPAEALLMGRAHSTVKTLAELPELCKTFLGFGPQEMGLKAALAVCPFDSPWREAVEALRAVIRQIRPGERWQVFLADSTPIDPGLVVALIDCAQKSGQDGKFALDALQISLSAGRAQWGHGARSEYNPVKASTELMLLEARASGHRRQTLTKMRQLLSEHTRRGLLEALAGAASPPEMPTWLAGEAPAEINCIMASLGLARRLLAY